MSAKKVALGGKPTKATPAANAEDWIADAPPAAADTGKGKMKRLTLDVSEDLHKKIKTHCAMNGTKIATELRELLLQKYGK